MLKGYTLEASASASASARHRMVRKRDSWLQEQLQHHWRRQAHLMQHMNIHTYTGIATSTSWSTGAAYIHHINRFEQRRDRTCTVTAATHPTYMLLGLVLEMEDTLRLDNQVELVDTLVLVDWGYSMAWVGPSALADPWAA